MNKIKKIIIFIIMLLMVFTINSYAADSLSCNSIESSASDFRKMGEEAAGNLSGVTTSEITSPIVSIVKMLTTAGILVVGIVMVILGIQWVMAKPSPEEQAKLKKKFVGLAVSAGVLFGAYTIWSVIVEIMDSIDGT